MCKGQTNTSQAVTKLALSDRRDAEVGCNFKWQLPQEASRQDVCVCVWDESGLPACAGGKSREDCCLHASEWGELPRVRCTCSVLSSIRSAGQQKQFCSALSQLLRSSNAEVWVQRPDDGSTVFRRCHGVIVILRCLK